jgi:hypothetical protein
LPEEGGEPRARAAALQAGSGSALGVDLSDHVGRCRENAALAIVASQGRATVAAQQLDAGTPSICRKAKLTGSMQSLLQMANPNVQARLSIVRAARQRVASQLGVSMNGPNPRRVQLQLHERRAGRAGPATSSLRPQFRGCCGQLDQIRPIVNLLVNKGNHGTETVGGGL